MSKVKNLIILIQWTLLATDVIGAPDYYWRDFFGPVPDDALLGVFDGIDRTYIGNVQIFDGGLFVGELKSDNPNITINGNVSDDNILVRTVSKNIKILCTQHPDNFEWMPADTTTLPYVPDPLVVGGWETENYGINYIGRAIFQNALRVGKIVGYDDNKGHFLYIAAGGIETFFTKYEVLVYRD